MVTKRWLTNPLDPERALARALSEATEDEIVLASGRSRFRVAREERRTRADHDPATLREGLERVAGLFSPGEGDRIIDEMVRRREQESRSIERPCAPRSIPIV